MNPATLINFVVSGIFQKPPGGLYIVAKRHLPFHVFSGFLWWTTWRWSPVLPGDISLRTQFLGFNELPGGDEHPPGGANQFGSILAFYGFWVNFDRRGKLTVIPKGCCDVKQLLNSCIWGHDWMEQWEDVSGLEIGVLLSWGKIGSLITLERVNTRVWKGNRRLWSCEIEWNQSWVHELGSQAWRDLGFLEATGIAWRHLGCR